MFKDKLKNLRENTNLYQKELASELNVTSQTISGWEIGRTTPDYEMLVKIANYFNVTTDYLLDNEKTSNIVKQQLYEKDVLKKLLIKNGYLLESEEITDKEISNLFEFIKINKQFIKNKRD